MRLTVIAVGALRSAPCKELCELYSGRLRAGQPLGPLSFKDVAERKATTPDKQKEEDGSRLLAAVPPGARTVVLDERGKSSDSRSFAATLGRWRDEGLRDAAFLIGGAEGHSADLRGKADLLLSFGTMTWPHDLARAMIAEQLYRANCILSGHPYHRD